MNAKNQAIQNVQKIQRLERALAREAAKVAEMRAQLDALKQAAKEFRGSVPLDVLRMQAGNAFLDMERVDNAAVKLEELLK